MTRSIDQPIAITAVRFTQEFDTIPRRLEFDGVSYELGGDYKKVTLTTDNGVESLLEVSDGTHQFKLRQRLHTLTWQLMSMTL